jgi:phosphoribosylamine--glycine ligase
MAAHGYPLKPRKGDAVTGLPKEAEDACVFHAGTQMVDGHMLTSGGRVLCVTVLADSVRLAQHRAYEVASGIRFDGMQYRTDIGYRAIKSSAI